MAKKNTTGKKNTKVENKGAFVALPSRAKCDFSQFALRDKVEVCYVSMHSYNDFLVDKKNQLLVARTKIASIQNKLDRINMYGTGLGAEADEKAIRGLIEDKANAEVELSALEDSLDKKTKDLNTNYRKACAFDGVNDLYDEYKTGNNNAFIKAIKEWFKGNNVTLPNELAMYFLRVCGYKKAGGKKLREEGATIALLSKQQFCDMFARGIVNILLVKGAIAWKALYEYKHNEIDFDKLSEAEAKRVDEQVMAYAKAKAKKARENAKADMDA